MASNVKPPLKLYAPLPRYGSKRWNWSVILVIAGIVLLSVGLTRFYDNIYFNHKTNQAVSQDKLFEANQGKDIVYLLRMSQGQVDCSKLLTNFSTVQCQEHNQLQN